MDDTYLKLGPRGMRPALLLPFHLVWFGRLSCEQGKIATRKGLISSKTPLNQQQLPKITYLTKHGKKMLRNLGTIENISTYRVYAYLIEAQGFVTEEPGYIYWKPPLSEKWDARNSDL